MKVITTRNVHQVLPVALNHLALHGITRESRNGPVLQAPTPVTTVYLKPWERVLFWPERDANPFFHLYESLWMLGGRNDVASLKKFVRDFDRFSDDGQYLHGAYGWRWKHVFGFNQLDRIIERLEHNTNDRRCVLQIWDPASDLDFESNDIPCNLTITFQIMGGALDMTIFCRSNDIIWGAYGANAVHFSMLQEYMALKIGVSMGKMYQISVNWHAYTDKYYEFFALMHNPSTKFNVCCPYIMEQVYRIPMDVDCNQWISKLLYEVDTEFQAKNDSWNDPWAAMVYKMLYAHHLWRTKAAPERYTLALEVLSKPNLGWGNRTETSEPDWIRAGREWILRRFKKWEDKQRA